MFSHQSVESGGPDASGSQEAKPQQSRFLRGGWDLGVSGRNSIFGHPQLRLLARQCLCRQWLTGRKPTYENRIFLKIIFKLWLGGLILLGLGSGPIHLSAPAAKSKNIRGLSCAGHSGSIFKHLTPLRCRDFVVFDLADIRAEHRHMPLK
jgi:hypothetical protein